MSKLTIDDCRRLAAECGGRCVSETFINSKEKLQWECEKRHIWWALYHNIKNRSWCPECSHTKRKTIQDAINVANVRGGKCISKSINGTYQKLDWQCKLEHCWKASLHSVNNGSWCPTCKSIETGLRTKNKYGLQIANKKAMEMGGVCLSAKYINNITRLKFQCRERHIFFKNFVDLVYGSSWCPKCHVYVAQELLTNIIKEIFPEYNVHSNYKNFDWLKTSKYGKQELDIYIPELKLAIEYDGEQHFKPVCFGGISKKQAEANLNITKKRDRLKNKKVKNHTEDVKYFIRFNYKERDKLTKEYVNQKLIKSGVNI